MHWPLGIFFFNLLVIGQLSLETFNYFPLPLIKSKCPMEVTNITCQHPRTPVAHLEPVHGQKTIYHLSQSPVSSSVACLLSELLSFLDVFKFFKPVCLLITFTRAVLSPLPYSTFHLAHSLGSTQSLYHMLLEHPSFFTFSL